MSPSTRRSRPSRPTHPPHTDGRERRWRTSCLVSPSVRQTWRDGCVRLLGGAIGAALGLGLCTVVVLLFWIVSPREHGGPEGPLRLGASFWLMAHGADLLRTGTGAGPAPGEPVPVGLTPLLLTVLPCWLLARAVRGALDEHRTPEWPGAVRAAATVAAGYLAAGAGVVASAAGGPLRADPLGAGLWLGCFVLLVTTVVVWLALGRPWPPLPRAVAPVCRAALPAAGLGTAVLVGGGLLLVVTALVRQGERTVAGLEGLGGSGNWSGCLGVAMLALALLPNAAIWAAAYGLGPGFTLGAGSVVAPLTASGGPGLPSFPLLAAVPPAETAGGPAAWATGAVPLAAALALGWSVGRAAAPVAAPVPRGRGTAEDTLGPRDAALAAVLAAGACGSALGALAALAGGALGNGALSHVGPPWWATGVAALCWGGAAGVPAACAVRAWRLRRRLPLRERLALRDRFRSGAREGAPHAVASRRAQEWHETGARRTRWAALKEASGGLMTDFPPRGRE